MMSILKTAIKLLLGRGSIRSYSQFGEDAVINAIFRHKKEGVYVDVGCYHPTLYSNTYALYKKGWRGLVIDPNTDMQTLFRFFRPRDRFVCAAIGNTSTKTTYYKYADPAYNSLSRERVEALSLQSIRPVEENSIAIKPLSELLASAKVRQIDLLNIDVEGLDLDVLRGYNWAIRPKVIIVEDHTFDALKPNNSELVSFLLGKEYVLEAYTGVSLIFLEKEVAKIR